MNVQTINDTCSQCPKDRGTYTLPVACLNCGWAGHVTQTMGHAGSRWECPQCGCREVQENAMIERECLCWVHPLTGKPSTRRRASGCPIHAAFTASPRAASSDAARVASLAEIEAALRAVPCQACGFEQERHGRTALEHRFEPDYPAMARAVRALGEKAPQP